VVVPECPGALTADRALLPKSENTESGRRKIFGRSFFLPADGPFLGKNRRSMHISGASINPSFTISPEGLRQGSQR
jgi:hypothetical protein